MQFYLKEPISTFNQLYRPIERATIGMPLLEARGYRPLKMTFEDQLKALIFFHLEEHVSAQHLLQVLEENDFARERYSPKRVSRKAASLRPSIPGALSSSCTYTKTSKPKLSLSYPRNMLNLVILVGIDGSLIDACLSMHWADYRKGSKKAKVHLRFDLNHGIPRKVFLSNGNGAERPFVSMILSPGQTGVTDHGYQAHDRFDQWQEELRHFVRSEYGLMVQILRGQIVKNTKFQTVMQVPNRKSLIHN